MFGSLRRPALLFVASLLTAVVAISCSSSSDNTVTLYTDRGSLEIGSLFEDYATANNISLKVRSGSTGELTALLLEEGNRTPADLIYIESGGALGHLAEAGLLTELPGDLLSKVDTKFRSPDGKWMGVTGRIRTIVYNTARIDPKDLPDSILGFTDPKWKGRIGWAPGHGETQGFITALRSTLGDAETELWLRGIQANQPVVYGNNIAITQGVASGAVNVGFVNHYYVHRFIAERGEAFGARNYYFENGAPGSFVDVSGVGLIATSKHKENALKLLTYLAEDEAQRYYAQRVFDFPVASTQFQPAGVPPLATLQPPDINISTLTDTQGTVQLMRRAGVLP